MAQFAQATQEPWVLLGDLNDIMEENEKKGGAPCNFRKCELFAERVSNCNLLDLGAFGNRFTWKGPLISGYERVYERLDMGLCNTSWRCLFQNAIVKNLARLSCSDHNPLLLCSNDRGYGFGLRPFRFEAMWLMHSEFDAMLRGCWKEEGGLTNKLMDLQPNLLQWNKEVFQHIQIERGNYWQE
ncbi:uncharacterized protein LOC114743269 [Neltuma alba]|uniref:uncharacterized protein LOC114743269 n=1 Tax=Neltuma alba TaxID=207710 RepID=UPI0010A45622|nr:uncharacterized protein LOC114743269 [Prosopis alba]